MIQANGMVPSLHQRKEHPAGTATQFKDRIACLSSKFKPKWNVLQIAVVMCVDKLWEHIIYKLV
jgi:hypothetical protein